MTVKAYIFEGIRSGFGYYQEEKRIKGRRTRKIVVQVNPERLLIFAYFV
jgi:hypothetical protein